MGNTRRCPACGAPIEDGAQFCANCGMSLANVGGASPQPTAARQPASPAPDQARPAYGAPATPMPSPVPAPSQDPPRNRSREIAIALASVAGALAVVAVVLALVNFMPHQTQDGGDAAQSAQSQASNGTTGTAQQQNADSNQGAGSGSGETGQTSTNVTYYISDSGTSSTTGSESAGSSSADTSILSALQAQKDTLNSYDSQIRGVADDFNRYSKNGSWDQQESAASTASQVQESLRGASSSFDGMDVPASSAYYGTYQSMQACYDDLQNRIDCMVSSWNMRLNGNSNYLSPIRAQNDSKGVNVYKTDFENRMASLGI